MKIIDKWFYIVYNSYYKHGNFTNDHPTWTVGGLFTFVMFSLILLIDYVYDSCIYGLGNIPTSDNRRYSIFEPSPAKLIALIGFVIIYFLFFYKKRHESIYETYKNDTYLNSKKAKFVAYSVIIFIYLLPFITPLFIHAFILKTYSKP